MKVVKMKIHDWDSESGSLIVSFTSDVSSQSLDNTQRLAYQPAMFDNLEPDYVLEQIAKSGASVCETQQRQESFNQEPSKLNEYQSLIGQQFEFSIENLFAPPEPVVLPIGSEPR